MEDWELSAQLKSIRRYSILCIAASILHLAWYLNVFLKDPSIAEFDFLSYRIALSLFILTLPIFSKLSQKFHNIIEGYFFTTAFVVNFYFGLTSYLSQNSPEYVIGHLLGVLLIGISFDHFKFTIAHFVLSILIVSLFSVMVENPTLSSSNYIIYIIATSLIGVISLYDRTQLIQSITKMNKNIIL